MNFQPRVRWSGQSRRPADQPLATPTLRMEVRGDDIVVTASAGYIVIYHKPANSTRLIAKKYPTKEDRQASMTLADFLISSSKLAEGKARELGRVRHWLPRSGTA